MNLSERLEKEKYPQDIVDEVKALEQHIYETILILEAYTKTLGVVDRISRRIGYEDGLKETKVNGV